MLRYGSPLRATLSQHRGLEIILNSHAWLCVDSLADDQLTLEWREFSVHTRDNLYKPVSCKLHLYHSCAGLIMGSVLDDLHQVLDQILIQKCEAK